MTAFLALTRFANLLSLTIALAGATLAAVLVGVLAAAPACAIDEIPLATTSRSEGTFGDGTSSAALVGGGFAAIWTENGFPSSELQMQWLDADGELVFAANGTTIASGVGVATLAANPTGGAFVAFGGSFANPTGIRVQSFDSDGDALWPGSGVLASTLDGLAVSPTLLPDGSGGVFVCFVLLDSQSIRCQRLSSDGNALWDGEGVSPGGLAGDQVRPLMVADEIGGAMVFWRNHRDASDNEDETLLMEGQRFDGDGNPQWGSGLLVRDTFLGESEDFRSDFFGVISDGAGGAILSFDGRPDGMAATRGVVAQRVAQNGNLSWGTGVPIAMGVTQIEHRGAIQPHDGGVVVIAGEEVSETDSRLRVYRLQADGQHLWPSAGVAISDPVAMTQNFIPRGSFDRDVLRVAWTSQLPGEQFEMDIYLARFRPDGSRLQPVIETVTSAPISQFCSSMRFSEETGKFFILWDDLRSNNFENSDVYAAEVPATHLLSDGFELGNTSVWASATP